jgi:pimeloyl-ACP methyl ester carboxylesterase
MPDKIVLLLFLALCASPVAAQRTNIPTGAKTMAADARFDAIFVHRKQQVNGATIHYVIGGKGDALVLIHGWPVTWYEWHKIMPALAEHYTVIAPDLRGMGDSEKTVAGYEKRNQAEDIHGIVTGLGFKTANIVGHDIGTMVAYAYAAAYSAEVLRLVMSEAFLPGFNLEQNMDTSKPGGLWHFGFHAAREIPEMLTQGREREYLSAMSWRSGTNPNAMSNDEIDEFSRCYTAPGAMRGGFEQYRTVLKDGEYNRQNFKGKLQMPVLALLGENSVIPKDPFMTGINAAAANVRFETVKGSGHWLAIENPDGMTRLLLDFLRTEK